MALRLEAAFGADSDELLRYQAVASRQRGRDEKLALAVRRYVPPFLKIRAAQIHEWADKGEEARSRLPVLLRILIRSTGNGLRRLDFPGYGEGQRPGWDGWVEASSATAWIPKGKSGWEFSTARDPGSKANRDLRRSRSDVQEDQRADTTFVFVSSRRWRGKRKWEEERRSEGCWKDVRAFDASDLEQWLEESIEGQVWLAEQLGLPSLHDCMTLYRAWDQWSEASEPPMARDLFVPAVAEHRAKIVSRLEEGAADGPLLVAADSSAEALAFLACLFRDEGMPPELADRAVVVHSARTLETLAPSTSRFIPIVSGREAERELASLYRRRPCIVVRPRNAVDQEPDIALGLLRYDTFQKTLLAMGLERDAVERLARDSGRSPTVLRRRLSKIGAIREPPWASDSETARKLVPMMFAGVWNEGSAADREVLRVLANGPYDEIEKDVASLLAFEDPPVWTVGGHRGVVSRIDALFAVGRHLTSRDLEDFLEIAEYVLSEADPALEMPRTRRWAAGLHGKVRNHSDALRTGVCETLVLLAVHGNDMFRGRLGIDVERQVASLVRRLLRPGGDAAPLAAETLESHERDLPMLAEAAPDEFLCLLEEDLDLPDSAVLALVKPFEATLFTPWPGTGVLWALECLAWSPSNLSRVALILAQVSMPRIDGNQVNKPMNSLEAIFRSWMPQTAANLEQRTQALRTLCGRVPEVGWHVCMKQIAPGLRELWDSYRPRWRGDAAGAGQPVSAAESREFMRGALDRALDWPTGHDASQLGDLVESLGAMTEPDQARVWSLLENWLAVRPGGSEMSAFRERLRRFAFATRRPFTEVDARLLKRAKEMHGRLLPADPVARHAWLFAQYWVEEWPEDTEETVDWQRREARIEERRTEAMREILESEGVGGALRLLPGSEAPEVTGRHVSLCLSDPDARAETLRECAAGDPPAGLNLESGKLDEFTRGFLFGVQADARAAVLGRAAETLSGDQLVRLFACAPFDERTWGVVREHGSEVARAYWQEVRPHRSREFSESERTELLDRLLEADRPRAAFFALSLFWGSVETSRLRDLLGRIAAGSGKVDANVGIDRYDVERAIESLNGRPRVTREQMAHLEFAFFEALRFGNHGFPNLQRHLAESPRDFVWLVSLLYKRTDGAEDPEGWPVRKPRRVPTLLGSADSVLGEMTRIPGTHGDEISAQELQAWVNEARRLGKEFGRSDMTDYCVGRLLSKRPANDGALWPCLPVCEAMETIGSDGVLEGFVSGAIEARGVVMRASGDTQEKELAVRYRSWASRRAAEFPFVGRVLEGVARHYDGSAVHWDTFDKLRERLGG